MVREPYILALEASYELKSKIYGKQCPRMSRFRGGRASCRDLKCSALRTYDECMKYEVNLRESRSSIISGMAVWDVLSVLAEVAGSNVILVGIAAQPTDAAAVAQATGDIAQVTIEEGVVLGEVEGEVLELAEGPRGEALHRLRQATRNIAEHLGRYDQRHFNQQTRSNFGLVIDTLVELLSRKVLNSLDVMIERVDAGEATAEYLSRSMMSIIRSGSAWTPCET
jgi:hypothetical protein